MNVTNNTATTKDDKEKEKINYKEFFSKGNNINKNLIKKLASLTNETLTIEIPKLEENKKDGISSQKYNSKNNQIYIILSLLLEQFSYNKILDSLVQQKEERNYSKLDKIINMLANHKGYSYFIKELITAKNDNDKIKLKENNEQNNKIGNLKIEKNLDKKVNKNLQKNKKNIEEDEDDSSDNNSFISNKEYYKTKNMYSLRKSKNFNKKLYLDSISNSEENSLDSDLDDLEISLEEEKKESDIEKEIEQENSYSKSSSEINKKNKKEIIDLSKRINSKQSKKANKEKSNEKNYEIDIDSTSYREEKNSYSRQRYYQKGGKFGMHYYLSEKDKRIYKYYSVQYNGDKSIGFRCTDTNCRSRAVLFPKSKEFKIMSQHTLKYDEHKKLQASMKSDKFIKVMENNELKEIQLTKKDNIKKILWYK